MAVPLKRTFIHGLSLSFALSSLSCSPSASPDPAPATPPPLASPPSPKSDGDWLAQAIASQAKGDIDAAITARRAALALPPNTPFEYLGLAQLEHRASSPQRAMKTVLAGLEAFPGDPDLTLRRGEYLGELGHHADALALVRSSRQADPEHLGLAYGEVDLLIGAGETPLAKGALKALEPLFGAEPEYLLRLGRLNLALGDVTSAQSAITAGIEAAGDCECTEEVRGALQALGATIELPRQGRAAPEEGQGSGVEAEAIKR